MRFGSASVLPPDRAPSRADALLGLVVNGEAPATSCRRQFCSETGVRSGRLQVQVADPISQRHAGATIGCWTRCRCRVDQWSLMWVQLAALNRACIQYKC